jgi:hypothetical protein
MQRWVTGLVLTVVAITGCGGDGATEPSEMADQLLQAEADGDNDRWRDLTSQDAISVFPDGTELALFGDAPWVSDDFDGDGVTSWADDLQFRNALHGPARQTMDWDCTTISDTEAACVVTATDAFVEAFGGAPMRMEMTYTFEDGRCVRDVGIAEDEAALAASNEAWVAGMAEYQRWVDRTHPDMFDSAFRGACCEAGLVMTEDAISIHDELLAEYLGED